MAIKPFIVALSMSLNLIDFGSGSYSNVAQNPIILDMDFCTDVDDAVALRMATTLDEMNVCTLMAVGLCTTANDGSDRNVRAAHGMLTYDGHEDVPIGTAHVSEPDTSPYWDVCAGYSTSAPESKDAVELYKEVLSSCYNKVTIVTTGYLTNIRYLLEDSEGYLLIRDNCEKIVITGGTFPSGRDNNFSFTANAASSVKYVEENCPVQIVYVPNDVGGKFTAGGVVQDLSPNDVLSKSLAAFGTQDGRAAWDPTAVFIAAVPSDVSNFDYIPITAEFAADGSHTFKEISSTQSTVPTLTYTIPKEDTDTKEQDGSEDYTYSNYTVGSNITTVSGNASTVSSDNSGATPSDMFETKQKENVNESQSTAESNAINTESKRVAVRHKAGVSAKQYQDMIEGILSYEYLR